MDILCTQAMVDDEIDEPEVDVENNNVHVATLKVLPCRKTGIPSMEFPIHIGENMIAWHLQAERDSCFLLDFGSSNKSRLGKMKLKPNVRYGLRDGDEVQFADVKCIFVQSNDDTTDDELLSIVEDTPVKPATIPDSQEVRETPVTKPVKIFPSKSSPLTCELPGTPCDEDITGRVESETSNNTHVKDDEPEKRKCETDKIDYHMDSETDIEDDHGNITENRDKKDDEDVYSAATLPLETESENPCSSPILSSLGLVKNTSDEVIAESDEEDLDEMSLLLNLDPVQTQSFADILFKETGNQISNQQEINNMNQIEEKPLSKLKDKSYGENEKASCSGSNSSSSTFPTAVYDTFDDMCTQAYTNDPMKSTNEAKRTECHDTLDILETQEYFAVHQEEGKEDQTDIDGDQDVSTFDMDDSFNMATQDFCRSPKVSLARDGTHLEVEETLPDILPDSEGTLYGTQYTDTEPMISPGSATASETPEIKSLGTPALLRSKDCTVPFAAYSSVSENINSSNIKRKSTMIENDDITTHSKISREGCNADPYECNGVRSSDKQAVESSDDTDDDTQIYSLSALRSQEKSSSQDSKISKNRASDALAIGNIKSKYVSDDTFPAQSSMESDTQSYSVTESVLNSVQCRVITQQTVSCNLELNSYSESENGLEQSENSSSDVLSSSTEVKLPSAGVDPISEDSDDKQFLTNSTESVSFQKNPPEESAVSSNECEILPTQGHLASRILKDSKNEEKDELTLEAHTPCDWSSKVTLDNAVEKMDEIQSEEAEFQPDLTNDMKDVQLEKSTSANILNIDGDGSKCFPAEAAEVKSLEVRQKMIPIAQDFLCTQPYVTVPPKTMLKHGDNDDVHNCETVPSAEDAIKDLKESDSTFSNKVIGKQSNATMLPSTSNIHTSLDKSIEVSSNFGEDDQCTQAYVSVSTNEVTVGGHVTKTVLTTDCSKPFESTELDDLCTQAYIKPIPNGRCLKQTVQSITASKLVRIISTKSQNPLPPSSDQDILATQSYITAPEWSSSSTSNISNTSKPGDRKKSEANTPVHKSSNDTGKIKGGRSRETAKLNAQKSVVRDETIEPPPRRSTRLSKRKSDQLRTECKEEETNEAKLSSRSSRSTRTRSTNRPTSNNEGAEENSQSLASTSNEIKFEEKLIVPVKKNTRGRKKNTAASSKSKTISSQQSSSCKETENTTAQKIKTESSDPEYVSCEIGSGSGSGLATDMNSLDGQASTSRIKPRTIQAETNLSDQSISSKSLKNKLKKEGSKKRRTDPVSSVSSSCSNVPKAPVRKKLKTEEDDDEDFQNTSLALRPRRMKPRVMFTGVTDAVGEAIVKELGGQMVQDISESTHLITDKIRRTIKFLCAVARGINIVSPHWLHMSKEHGRFLPEEEFELKDSLTPDSGNLQTKFKFQLHNSLETARSSTHYLFHGLSVFVTRNVIPPPDQMHQIIRCAGGEVLKKMPTAVITGTSPPVVIAADSDKRACLKAVKGGCYVVSNEFILTGILRQHLDFDSFTLFGSGSANASSEVMKNKAITESLSVNGAEEETENNVDSLKENSTPNTSNSRSRATRTSKRKTRKKIL